MKPIIAIVGRPNVGKSTFFNRLTNTRDALVADRPGVTRDRQYGVCFHEEHRILIIDTGGIGEEDHDSHEVAELMTKQSFLAAEEASVLIWIVDGRAGLTNVDEIIAQQFRKLNKPVFLAVNKIEGFDTDVVTSEFFKLGIDSIWPISAKRGDGIDKMLNTITSHFSDDDQLEETDTERLTISVLGRPNVGKSTLVNRMLGEERVLTFDHPGTTRDSIQIPFERNGKKYILIDTAGVRRKSKIQDVVEKFSAIKSFEAIEKARVMILVVDASEGVTEQDSALLGMIENSGKSLIVAVNKWDGLEEADKKRLKSELERRFKFIDYAQYHYISALHGTGVGDIFKSLNKILKSLNVEFSTSDMTDILQSAVESHPPQLVRGRRIKLRYAHIGGTEPIRIIIHGNQVKSVPDHYKRYLAKYFRKTLRLVGTPVLIDFKQGDNPYKGKKNQLNQRQIDKRRRLMKHVKK